MKENRQFITPDDPRLTAYALGELDPSEHEIIDAAVRNDPSLQAAVNEIREMGGALSSALAAEPDPVVAEPVPNWSAGRDGAALPEVEDRNDRDGLIPRRRSKLLRFPTLYYVVAGAAAAAWAVMVTVREFVFPVDSARSRVADRSDPKAPGSDSGESGEKSDSVTTIYLTSDLTVPPLPVADPKRAAIKSIGDRIARELRYDALGRVAKAAVDPKDVHAAQRVDNDFSRARDWPLSTFSIEVDTTSYATTLESLREMRLPPAGLVRIEELINYFPYQYAPPVEPRNRAEPVAFAAHMEVASAPWAPNHRLVRIGLKGREGAGLGTIARDVTLQVEFNPAQVSQYRLIGYENRVLEAGDFHRDAIYAGEVGAGHSVTALYEVIPTGVDPAAGDPGAGKASAYRRAEAGGAAGQKTFAGEMLTLKLSYKEPARGEDRAQEFPLSDGGADFESASSDFQFAAAVASFGMVLRDSPHRGVASLANVTRWAQRASATDPGGRRTEFLGLVRQAERIQR